jgi:hypothetical protein
MLRQGEGNGNAPSGPGVASKPVRARIGVPKKFRQRFRGDRVLTGEARFVTLDFPLEDIHRLAFNAATPCAEDQGKF